MNPALLIGADLYKYQTDQYDFTVQMLPLSHLKKNGIHPVRLHWRPIGDKLESRGPQTIPLNVEGIYQLIMYHLIWSNIEIETPFLSFNTDIDHASNKFRYLMQNTWERRPEHTPEYASIVQLDAIELAKRKPDRAKDHYFLVKSQWGSEILIWKSLPLSDIWQRTGNVMEMSRGKQLFGIWCGSEGWRWPGPITTMAKAKHPGAKRSTALRADDLDDDLDDDLGLVKGMQLLYVGGAKLVTAGDANDDDDSV